MTIGNKQITKPFLLKIAGFAVIGLAVLGVVVYIGLMWREKRQFIQAEKDISTISAQIIEEVGRPDQEIKDRSCGYASRKFSRGPRGCSVSIYLLYKNKGVLESNVLVGKISSLLNIKPSGYAFNHKTMTGSDEYEFKELDDGRLFDRQLSTSLNTGFDKGCSIGLTHPGVGTPYREMFDTTYSEKNFVVGLSCGGPAMAEYFPLKD